MKDKIIKKLSELTPCSISDSIVITGSPRSGTTWLSEILWNIPGYRLLDEPLHVEYLNYSGYKNLHNLDWRQYLDEDTSFNELEDYLTQALQGQYTISFTWRFKANSTFAKAEELFSNRKVVAKCIRVSRMLPWFSKRFPVRAFVSIYRHPCAVISSQIKYQENWRYASPSFNKSNKRGFGGKLPDEIIDKFGSTLTNIDTTIGTLAANWSIDTYMSLKDSVYSPRIITTYEDLLEKGEKEISRILNYIGESNFTDLNQSIDQRSKSAANNLVTSDNEIQLMKWKKSLTKDQIDTILQIINEFELNFYDESIRPHHELLSSKVI